jgi:acetyl-CoA carboxylase biotin carboxyl carrier protein
MPEPHRPGDRTAAQRKADHAGLARLSETLVPALVTKLNASGLGELEVREGDWRVRLRRPSGAAPARRADRSRTGSHGPTPAPTHAAVPTAAQAATHPDVQVPPGPERVAATSPVVGVFRAVSAVGAIVRAGDQIAIVDLLGIPQDGVAPIDGIVAEIFAQAGDAVEYGEAVMLVEAQPEELPASDAPADEGA